MFDKTALEYLNAHTKGYHIVEESLEPHSTEFPAEVVAVPNDTSLHSLEQFMECPTRIKASVRLDSSGSFCDYVNRFKDNESTIYIDTQNGLFKAIIDHHGSETPKWCSHSAKFQPRHSLEWEAWKQAHNEKISQVPFALLIEQLLDSIHKPEPNEVLKAALDFQANENLVLGSATNLDDGSTRFVFNKDNVTKTVTFPHRIKLWMSLYENENQNFFDCRIRYRVDNEGALFFVFSFVKDPVIHERDAILSLADSIKYATEGLPHYEGILCG